MNKQDETFLAVALDRGRREKRLQRLETSRKLQWVAFLAMTFATVCAYFADSSKLLPVMVGVAVLNFVVLASTDLTIKMLLVAGGVARENDDRQET